MLLLVREFKDKWTSADSEVRRELAGWKDSWQEVSVTLNVLWIVSLKEELYQKTLGGSSWLAVSRRRENRNMLYKFLLSAKCRTATSGEEQQPINANVTLNGYNISGINSSCWACLQPVCPDRMIQPKSFNKGGAAGLFPLQFPSLQPQTSLCFGGILWKTKSRRTVTSSDFHKNTWKVRHAYCTCSIPFRSYKSNLSATINLQSSPD